MSVASHIREAIRQAKYVEPLPSTREWARQLHVGRNTLFEALRLLQAGGWVAIRSRKDVQLAAREVSFKTPAYQRIVRLVYRGSIFLFLVSPN